VDSSQISGLVNTADSARSDKKTTVSLATLIREPRTRVDDIARHLDERDHVARWAELSRLSRDEQRMLYEKAAESPPIDLEHFAPNPNAGVEAIHEGRNTLPLPPVFRHFQKRFCRPAGDRDELFGYNEGPTRRFVGPGYFVTIPTEGRPHWEARGAVVVDYFQVPQGAVAPGWPEVIPNDRGMQRFVYDQTRDFMRRVSNHVSIGAAFKNERPLDHYFVLCRRD
jgi:hypothetical protein